MGGKRRFLCKEWLLCFFILGIVLLSLGLSVPVFAEDKEDNEDSFTLEEITVTAEKREAVLQKVPMDITVVRPDDMDRLGITTAYDIKKILPDVDTSSPTGNQVLVTIRGVGSASGTLFNPIHETTTAVHLDGVQMTRSNGFDNLFYDLQRIEVLKGPQGTLYGRGSTGGSMNITTQKPILGEVGGNLNMEYGNYGLKRADGAVNIPVVEKLAFRVSGRKIKRNGYSDAGFNDQNSWGARLSMTWEPTPKDVITMTYDAGVSRGHGYRSEGMYFKPYSSDPSIAMFYPQTDPVVETDPDTGEKYFGEPNVPDFLPYQTWLTNVIDLPNQSKWYLGDAADKGEVLNKSWGYMAQWEHEFGFAYAVTLYGHRVVRDKNAYVSVTAPSAAPYQPYMSYEVAPGALLVDENGDPFVDENGDPLTNETYFKGFRLYGWAQSATLGSYSRSFSHTDQLETRLVSKETITAGDKYEWVVGAMGQHDRVEEIAYLGSIQDVKITTDSIGLYGQASYQIYQNWNLSVGYRYSNDEKEYWGIYPGYWGTDPNVNNFPYNFPYELPYVDKTTGELITGPTIKKAEWGEHTYKANLNWFITDSAMSYMQYSKGYRTGNFDYHGQELEPEYLDSYEFGLKSRFFNNRLQFNLSAYYYNYKNYSTWASAYKCNLSAVKYPDDPHGPGSNTYKGDVCWDYDDEGVSDGILDNDDYVYNESFNVSPGGAEQFGGNVSMIFLVTSKDTVTLTGSYSHNEYKNYNIGEAINKRYPDNDSVAENEDYQHDRDGEEFGGAPYRFNIGYVHTAFIGMDMLSFNVNAFYNGKDRDQVLNRYEETEYTMPGRPAYWTADTSITFASTRWVPEGVRWTARLWANNVFNSHHLSSLYYTDFTSSSIWASYNLPEKTGYATGSHIQPRTYGMTLSFDF